MDRCRMDRKKMLLSHTLTMRGSHIASLAESTQCLGGDSMTDRWMDNRCMDGRVQGKIMLLSHNLTMMGSDVASLVKFRPVVLEEIV